MMTLLSAHFTLEEATLSSTAQRLGIANTPGEAELANMHRAAIGMEFVRAALLQPIHVDSWFRCQALEKVITQKDYVRWCGLHGQPVNDASWAMYFNRKGHPRGYAVDFVCPQFGTPLDIVHAIQKSGIKFDQLIQEGGWVHISFDPQMRGQVMTATFSDGTPNYTAGA
jgi:hypothetical protein